MVTVVSRGHIHFLPLRLRVFAVQIEKSIHFWQSFFSAPSAPLRDAFLNSVEKQGPRRDAEGAEKGAGI
jgi:hypothetical protein